ncbi:lysozyme g-like isoform X1 [Lethenteron reissneri]|uniref:lysozyme g-like isoform X1 n=1 Tax=Lethenteron reissneri TaxID=7753 RepID=UPI002AB755E6|nr:lysozyme g-like isoform X1 [Lethenteron reissneri]
MLGPFVILLFVSSAAAADSACTGQGGECLDWRTTVCRAGVATSLCNGDSNRRCCLQCNSACVSNEQSWSANDGQCTDMGGKCQVNSNYCGGSYSSGLCGGPNNRQCCIESQSGGSGTGCYGDLMNIDTTGASIKTAKQDKLSEREFDTREELLSLEAMHDTTRGVAASKKLVNADLNRLKNYKTIIVATANAKCMDPAVIAAIISRESRAGALLVKGFGDNGNGFGLMQVDKRFHNTVGTWDSEDHLKQGTGILIDMISAIKKKFPNWTQDQQMKGGISAYNAGTRNVGSYANMDIGTTGDDYANDVVARAQYLRDSGHF